MTNLPKFVLSILVLSILITACSTTRIVKPLKAKEAAVGFDFGGPIIDFAGAKIPMPLTSFSGAYGLDSLTTVFGGLHTTSLAAGVLQVDAGVVRDIIPAKGKIPGFSVAPVANAMIDFQEAKFRFFPEIDLNMHWQYSLKRQNYLYFSVANWFNLYGKKAHDQPNKNYYIPNLALGHTFVNKTMRYTLELKWLAPTVSNQRLTVGYNGIAGQGSMGFYFSVYRRF